VTVQYDGQEIYENFKKGPGPEGLNASAEIVHDVVREYQALAERVHRLAVDMESAWDGAAGDGARGGARPVATEHELAGGELLTAQDLVSRQVDSFIEARNRVVPVPPAPTEVRPWRLDSPDTATTFMRQLTAHLAAAQNNIDVMNGYTGASDHNTVHLPMSYGTLTSADIPLGQAGEWFDLPDEPTPLVERDVSGQPHGASTSGSTSGEADAPAPEPGKRPESTTSSGTSGTVGPATGSATVSTAAPTTGRVPALATVIGSSPAAAEPGAPAGIVGAAKAATGEPVRPLVGLGSPGGAQTARAPRASTTTHVRTDTRTMASHQGIMRAGIARSGGSLGGLPVGTARQEEDIEHRAPAYLEERDPEELFGSDEVVAPETIGLNET
jgi:hypothetical protein